MNSSSPVSGSKASTESKVASASTSADTASARGEVSGPTWLRQRTSPLYASTANRTPSTVCTNASPSRATTASAASGNRTRQTMPPAAVAAVRYPAASAAKVMVSLVARPTIGPAPPRRHSTSATTSCSPACKRVAITDSAIACNSTPSARATTADGSLNQRLVEPLSARVSIWSARPWIVPSGQAGSAGILTGWTTGASAGSVGDPSPACRKVKPVRPCWGHQVVISSMVRAPKVSPNCDSAHPSGSVWTRTRAGTVDFVRSSSRSVTSTSDAYPPPANSPDDSTGTCGDKAR